MTGMNEYEKLKELYEHMMAVRKESRQHIQECGSRNGSSKPSGTICKH